MYFFETRSIAKTKECNYKTTHIEPPYANKEKGQNGTPANYLFT